MGAIERGDENRADVCALGCFSGGWKFKGGISSTDGFDGHSGTLRFPCATGVAKQLAAFPVSLN